MIVSHPSNLSSVKGLKPCKETVLQKVEVGWVESATNPFISRDMEKPIFAGMWKATSCQSFQGIAGEQELYAVLGKGNNINPNILADESALAFYHVSLQSWSLIDEWDNFKTWKREHNNLCMYCK